MATSLQQQRFYAPLGDLSDECLVVLAKDGVDDAYAELSRRHHQMVFRLVNRITRNDQDSEDVVQESLLKAFVHLESFNGRSKFSTWLTRIAINTALMGRRRARRRLTYSLDDHINEGLNICDKLQHPSVSPESDMITRDQKSRMGQAVQALPPALRVVLEKRLSGERSVQEVADVIGITVAAAKSRLLRAQRAVIIRMKARENIHNRVRPVQTGQTSAEVSVESTKGPPKFPTVTHAVQAYLPQVSRPTLL